MPARLVIDAQRWYIVYHQVIAGERKRFRETHDLNRIKNLTERRKRANEIVKEINARLPNGYPFDVQKSNATNIVTLSSAIATALAKKLLSPRKNSHKTYKTTNNYFQKFMEKRKLADTDIKLFTPAVARAFLDFVVTESTKPIGGVTYNNYQNNARALFSELVKSEIIEKNPFSNLEYKRVAEKKRKALTNEERDAFAAYLKEKNEMLWLATMLIYACRIRPAELLRIKFSDIDLVEGVIRLHGDIKKCWKPHTPTIPYDLLVFLRNFCPQYPANYIIFGENVKPHPNKSCGAGTLSQQHRNAREVLHKLGKISDPESIHFYSWKDTGNVDTASLISVQEQVRQNGHATADQTLKYYTPPEVNENIKTKFKTPK